MLRIIGCVLAMTLGAMLSEASCAINLPMKVSCPLDGGLRAEHLLFVGDATFLPAEREEIERAAAAWRYFTDGRIDYWVAWGGTGAAHIHRRMSDDPWTLQEESVIGHSFAAVTEGLDITLLVDRSHNGELIWEMAAHEMGHVADMRIPGCQEGDCVHTPDKDSIMSAALNGATTFTTADLKMCKESCICD